jgi:Transcriptional regulator/sugar kinase
MYNWAAGFDFGATNTKGIFYNGQEVVVKKSYKTDVGGGIEAAFSKVKQFCAENIPREFWPQSKIAIGYSTPGVWGRKAGRETVLSNSPNLRWLENCDIIPMTREEFGIFDCYGMNDAKCQIYGQVKFGSAKGGKVVIGLTLGTGIGGAIIIGGKIFLGAKGQGGELGHIIIDHNINARVCGCGNRGCLEAYAGTAGILKTFWESFNTLCSLEDGFVRSEVNISVKDIFALAKPDDSKTVGSMPTVINPACLVTVSETALYLAEGLAPLINAFNPDVIVFDGQIAKDLPMMEPQIRKWFEQNLSQKSIWENLKIVQSSDPEYSGAIGAAAYALARKNGEKVIMEI